MAYQTFTHQIWWGMVCYDLAHQIWWAKHTFSGRCDITPMVCCSFGGHSTPQFLQCMFPDSEIAKTFACGHTKTAAIIKEALSAHF